MTPVYTALTRDEGAWDIAGRRVCACWAGREAAGRAGYCCVVRLSGDTLIQLDGHQGLNRLITYSAEPCNT
jgi:hypothetical protein